MASRRKATSKSGRKTASGNSRKASKKAGGARRKTGADRGGSRRKYGQKASDEVGSAMHEMKEGELRSGSGQKVTNPKQAIAIGLSKARRKGGKVPERKGSRSGAGSEGGRSGARKAGARGGRSRARA
jgi:hypothetical protein